MSEFKPNLDGFRPEPPNPKHWSYEDKLEPKMKALETGDVDLREFSGPRHNQWSTGSCFPVGTPVLMADYTERPIEDVGEGNEVLTHNGKRGVVTHRFHRAYEDKLYTLDVAGYAYPITMTSEHPVFVAKNISKRKRYFEAGEPDWVVAKDIEPGDYVLMPGNTNISLDEKSPESLRVADYLSDEVFEHGGRARARKARLSHTVKSEVLVDGTFARLMGLFLAEGSYKKQDGLIGGVTFTFARDEVEYQDFVVAALATCLGVKALIINQDSRPSVSDVRCYNATLGRFFFALCGEGALGKRVPPVMARSGHSVRLSLLRGWLEGDGTQKKVLIYEYEDKPNRALCVGVTSSERLHRGLMQLSLLCGMKPSALIRKQESHQNAPARTLSFYSRDILMLFPEEAANIEKAGIIFHSKMRTYRRHPLGFLCRVSAVSTTQPENPVDVYNIEVEGENTYIANGIAVHNCVANAVVKALEIKRNMKLGVDNHIDLSRMAVYYLARELMHPAETHMDDGTYISLGFDALRRFGACQETEWPFDTSKVSDPPSWKAMRKAFVNKIDSFYRIGSTGQDRINEVIKCLRAGNPVVFGTAVNGWGEYRDGDVLFPPSDVRGRHAIVIVGYVDGNFIIENSWGTWWGADGYALVDPSYIADDRSRDFWVVQAGFEEYVK